MRGAAPPLPQYVFMTWCLITHRDNFTFTFIWIEYYSESMLKYTPTLGNTTSIQKYKVRSRKIPFVTSSYAKKEVTFVLKYENCHAQC
jgi:hypothetical protein